jgi:hypothetical protein
MVGLQGLIIIIIITSLSVAWAEGDDMMPDHCYVGCAVRL